MCKSSFTKHRQAGFTLLEVLVSILILSFGMLGLVGMQAFALQSNREARIYSQAINHARELAEMLRGNNQIAIKTGSSDNPYLTTTLSPSNVNSCLKVGSTPCTSTKAVAESQMTDWLSRLNNALPGARVSVCFDSQPYDSNGLPTWTCTPGAAGTDEVIMIKIGWTMRALDSSQTGDNALLRATSNPPQVVIPVTGGNPFALAQ
ncbi:MAG: type IV pilus modification protein PilV [Comamonas sp.]|jgi:type IV pilus assembly protein PilV|nr:type IV pilus modification protein PilV [Comamonas sp.]